MPEIPITPGSPSRSTNGDTHMDDAPPANSMATRPAAEVPYSPEFEDGVMHAVLNPPSTSDGVEARGPLPAFLLGRDTVQHHELPLPLDDPRRQYKSLIAGIKLTHPTGAYEGGNPEPTEEDRAWLRGWMERNNVKTKEDLERAKAQTIEEDLEEVRKRAQARKQAIGERERIEKELKALKDQREVELKAQRSIIEKAKAKKEERRAKRTKLSAPVDEAPRRKPPSTEPVDDDIGKADATPTPDFSPTVDLNKSSTSASPPTFPRKAPPTAPAKMRMRGPSSYAGLSQVSTGMSAMPHVAIKKEPPTAPAKMRMEKTLAYPAFFHGGNGTLSMPPAVARRGHPTAPARTRSGELSYSSGTSVMQPATTRKEPPIAPSRMRMGMPPPRTNLSHDIKRTTVEERQGRGQLISESIHKVLHGQNDESKEEKPGDLFGEGKKTNDSTSDLHAQNRNG